MNSKKKTERSVKGIPASPGISIGPVFMYQEPSYVPEKRIIPRIKQPAELKKFKTALNKSKQYLMKILEESNKHYGREFAEIIQIQISILEDDIFLEEVEALIREQGYDAAYATFKVFQSKKEYFLKLSDEYFRDRAFDIQTLKRLILKNLLGKKLEVKLSQKSIVVADNINPADIIKLHNQKILGFCTNVGGKNSHAAIVARSLGVPAVVGTEIITKYVTDGTEIILDGNQGEAIINPGQKTISRYRQKKKKFIILEKSFLKDAQKPAETRDGQKIEVMVNIEFEEELNQIGKVGAEGIGLYRTEALFLSRNEIPSEDLQTEVYLKIAGAAKPQASIIRTLDVGGDKILPGIVSVPERNPFLGWRAIRFCLDHKEIFMPQLKAILRANIHGNVKLLIPMVSSPDEICEFHEALTEAKRFLDSEGKEYNPDLPVGIMIEIPSAAIMAERFIDHVDFFSIGTNDLIQYTLAVDRANERISHLYSHFHPALLYLIDHVIRIGEKCGIPVNMCGEMAADPVAIPILLGMGLTNLSASHVAIPEIKDVIRHITLDECRRLYQNTKEVETVAKVKKLCEDFYKSIFTIPHDNQRKNNPIYSKV